MGVPGSSISLIGWSHAWAKGQMAKGRQARQAGGPRSSASASEARTGRGRPRVMGQVFPFQTEQCPWVLNRSEVALRGDGPPYNPCCRRLAAAALHRACSQVRQSEEGSLLHGPGEPASTSARKRERGARRRREGPSLSSLQRCPQAWHPRPPRSRLPLRPGPVLPPGCVHTSPLWGTHPAPSLWGAIFSYIHTPMALAMPTPRLLPHLAS